MRQGRTPALFILCLFVLCGAACRQRVQVGCEVLIERHLDLLANHRVGLICNQTSILPNGTHLLDTLLRLGVKISVLFGPEHGIRGEREAGEAIAHGSDPVSGLPLYSLYGETRKPTPEMLTNVDILLFDMQDVGARFYTFASTMALAMEAAGEVGKKFIILDRPNPIGGIEVEGPVLDTLQKSFLGMFAIPVRHGLTLGELARMIVGEKWISSAVDLTVVSMEGWSRSMWFDETGLPWVPPSPNMVSLSTATVYPGTCLLEATNISEGRGTESPFEFIGAPWINGRDLAMRLNLAHPEGVEFLHVRFTPRLNPTSAIRQKYESRLCEGVKVNVIDRNKFKPVRTGALLLTAILEAYPDSARVLENRLNRLLGISTASKILPELQNGTTPDSGLAHYLSRRDRYLLYGR